MLSRDALMEKMYNRKATPFDRSIDMHVSHLRKKLETATYAHQDHARTRVSVLPHARRGGRGVKSLFAKILLWFWATLAVTIIGSGIITAINVDTEHGSRRSARLVRLQTREARLAYEEGGKHALAEALQRFRTFSTGEQF